MRSGSPSAPCSSVIGSVEVLLPMRHESESSGSISCKHLLLDRQVFDDSLQHDVDSTETAPIQSGAHQGHLLIKLPSRETASFHASLVDTMRSGQSGAQRLGPHVLEADRNVA